MKKGFTLLELLVVIIIMAALTALSVRAYRESMADASVSKAKVTLARLGEAYLSHLNDNPGVYLSFTPPPKITNTNFITTGTCDTNTDPGRLVRFGYMKTENWDSFPPAYSFHLCNNTMETTVSGCRLATASTTYDTSVATLKTGTKTYHYTKGGIYEQ